MNEATEAYALRTACEEQIEKVVVGQSSVISDLMVALVSEGHALIEGVPGTAKTTLVRALARSLSLDFGRIQFTPDLMPSDIVGTHIYGADAQAFRLVKGPIFAQIMLADEINRAPAKTQSALLEAMQERQVTVEGETIALPKPFLVFATQNPVEHEGTYPLPSAQLDRFMLKLFIDYPSEAAEVEMLETHRGDDAGLRQRLEMVTPIADAARLQKAKEEALAAEVRREVVEYIVEITRQTRDIPEVSLGASPRAALMLQVGAKARAVLDGRDYVTPDDVKAVVIPVMRHRIELTPSAEVEGLTSDEVLGRVVDGVTVPR